MPEDRSPCRDFERGDCNRGDKCKYYHPEGATPAENVKVGICNDYQTKGCSRMKCKFLHLTPEEEAIYKSSGTLPEHGGHPEKSSIPSFMGKDVCKDFLHDRCDRGSRCKYMHVSERELHGNNAPMGGMYGKRPRVYEFYGGTSDAVVLQENGLLRIKVTDLQKEIINLRQMNDELYNQNTRYRSQLKNTSTATVGQVNMYNQAAAVPATAITSGMSTYSY